MTDSDKIRKALESAASKTGIDFQYTLFSEGQRIPYAEVKFKSEFLAARVQFITHQTEPDLTWVKVIKSKPPQEVETRVFDPETKQMKPSREVSQWIHIWECFMG